MTKLAFVFTVCTVTLLVINSVVSQGEENAENGHEKTASLTEDDFEDRFDRSSLPGYVIANAKATAAGNRPGLLSQPPGRMVECYACSGCESAQNATTKLCPLSFDHTKQTKCVVYAEKYNHMEKPWYIRGCASERGSCAEIRASRNNHRDIVQLLFCKECDGERCNESNGAMLHSIPDLVMAFVTMIVTPVLAKYTMS